MTNPIDYSRPVGWWCPVCTLCVQASAWMVQLRIAERLCCCSGASYTPVIPWFLPIPEGQRPLVEDEVESAEVVTSNNPAGYLRIASPNVALNENGYVLEGQPFIGDWYDGDSVDVAEINRIAQASTRARIVTGATE